MAQYKGAAKEASRAMNLIKKRQKEQEELEIRKRKIEDDLKLGAIKNKFATHYNAVENQLKSSTVGLVTLNEMKAKQEDVIKQRELEVVKDKNFKSDSKPSKEDKKKQKIANTGPLSFDMTEFDEVPEEVPKAKKIKMCKCPDVDTSFLPDRERDEKEAILREQLRQEWNEKQDKIKNEDIAITYSYWDGSGHRRQVKMKKGNSIQQFLQKCLEQLRREFNELKTASVDRLMYIKEDLIIAHHFTFYDFIVTKARGKSGPLFNFDVHDDIRMVNDATVEKDESHAGKVCLRSWYEKNKHIFPASRWEPYDPEKKWDKYTIADPMNVI